MSHPVIVFGYYSTGGKEQQVDITETVGSSEEEAMLPTGFIEGLDQMMADPPSVKPGRSLYFPMCSYGAHWGVM